MHWQVPGTLILALFTTIARGQTAALSFDTNQRWSLGTGPSVFGWEFTVTRPIRVTSLGIWDNPPPGSNNPGGDGLGETHLLGLWNAIATQTPLATALIPSGTTADLQNTFRYVAIPPMDLSPGQRYVIGAAYAGVGDWVVSSANNPTFAITTPSVIVFQNRRSGPGGPALSFPEYVDTEFIGDFGPNFLFTEVPEPSTIALSIFALGATGFLRLRNRGFATRSDMTARQH